MKTRVLAGLVCCLALAADSPEAPKKAPGKMPGTWEATSIKYNGEEVLGEAVKSIKTTISEDKFSVAGDGPDVERYGKFAYKIDPKAKQPTIDLTHLVGEDKGLSLGGIYQLDGDELQLCVKLIAEKGAERPTELKSEEGSNVVLAVFKRVKP
jgi:uncharacterized protein (TIGR03067 family)